MSVTNRDERLKYLSEIKSFEEEITGKINGILDTLNWDRETLRKNYEKRKCSEDKRDKEENVQFSEDYKNFYSPKIPSLTIDGELQAEIIKNAYNSNPEMILKVPLDELNTRMVPKSAEDFLFNFTKDERLCLYEYAAENLKNPIEQEKSYPLKMPEESSSKSMTFAQVVDLEKQLKRRRMKHRTTKEPPLSYTETIRKLINTQTEAWESYIKQTEEKKEHREHRKQKKESKKHKKKRKRSRS
ncbi:U11/U12 small nuclear ribonucleoprotein 48 kDa protein [Sergentomyia squamirostris]